jgi:hypothetical protein
MRADHEFTDNHDLTLAVILSAMAFESELSRLHHKCLTIAALQAAREISDEELDELLRKHPNIRDKIDHVACLLHGPGLDHFVAGESDINQIVKEGFPSLHGTSLAEGVQKFLFWPRNRVVHMGRIVRERQEAIIALNVARLGILIFDRMDKKRRWLT